MLKLTNLINVYNVFCLFFILICTDNEIIMILMNIFTRRMLIILQTSAWYVLTKPSTALVFCSVAHRLSVSLCFFSGK